MNHVYELSEKDIINIIAEKFNCNDSCVHIRAEKEYVLMGSKETIKATVRKSED